MYLTTPFAGAHHTARVAKLTAADRFADGKNSPLGLPKVLSIKVAAGKKPKTEAAAGDAAAKPDAKKK
jgi:hypothetical protein